ncbi:MAG: sigma-70 family RNA polymerase sigma factor [Alphaproteobacteria bacterium]|nr:sigma-70 family RNA polymerase sigma factor [Alphaproteobacteria bacterium]
MGRIDVGTPEISPAAAPALFNFKREMLAVLPSLRAFAVSLARRHDKADDLVQETVMKAWGKQESFQPGTSMRAWLFTILRNEFYSQMRRKGRELPDPDGVFAGNLATHPEQYGKLDMADFKTALDTLPDDQREAIVLIGASGFSYEEAAEIAGVAVGTIKSRVNRARVKLQELLAVDGESDYGPDETSRPLVNKAFPGR